MQQVTVYDDAGHPKMWTRQKLIERVLQMKASFKGLETRRAALETDLIAEPARAETAERRVRDLRRELDRERKRADGAEARPNPSARGPKNGP